MKLKRARKPEEMKEYYKDKAVVGEYIDKRFSEPIFKVEHATQAGIIQGIINRNKCRKVLEIACGPARLTKHIRVKEGTALDYSDAMLRLARKRMGKKSPWKFVKGDAFKLKFKKNYFDMVFTFRFVFHFHKKKRAEFYKGVRNVLKKGGFFAFEAQNRKKVKPVRKFVGEEKYNVFSEMFEKEKLTRELEKNGFKVVKMYPHVNHFWTEMLVSRSLSFVKLGKLAEMIIRAMEIIKSSNPYEWVVLCQKK